MAHLAAPPQRALAASDDGPVGDKTEAPGGEWGKGGRERDVQDGEGGIGGKVGDGRPGGAGHDPQIESETLGREAGKQEGWALRREERLQEEMMRQLAARDAILRELVRLRG